MADTAAPDTIRPPGSRELRNMAANMVEFPEFRFMPSHLEDFARGVLAALDRIEEMERQWHVYQHGCHWVDCPENPPYHSVPHNHCPEGCRFTEVPANDSI